MWFVERDKQKNNSFFQGTVYKYEEIVKRFFSFFSLEKD